MIRINWNDPNEEFTLGIHGRNIDFTELDEGETPDEDTEWFSMYEIIIGFLIFSIRVYV